LEEIIKLINTNKLINYKKWNNIHPPAEMAKANALFQELQLRKVLVVVPETITGGLIN
jgi:hypothetical protein